MGTGPPTRPGLPGMPPPCQPAGATWSRASDRSLLQTRWVTRAAVAGPERGREGSVVCAGPERGREGSVYVRGMSLNDNRV